MTAASFTIEVAATGTIMPKPGRLFAIIALAGTSPTCRLFDNIAASGTEIFPASVLTAGSPVNFPGGIPLRNGLHATIGGTSSPRVLLVLGGH